MKNIRFVFLSLLVVVSVGESSLIVGLKNSLIVLGFFQGVAQVCPVGFSRVVWA